MKAAVWLEKDVIAIKDIPKPGIKPNEVLLRVKAAGVCMTDIHRLKGVIKIGEPPQVMGHEIAGEIIELGNDVHNWNTADRVVVETNIGCGDCYYCRRGMKHLCINGGEIGYAPYQGGYAEYVTVPASNIYKIPDNVSYEEAGILESFICPAGSIYRIGMHFGDSVLVIGAGPAGLAYIQACRVNGATKIIVAARRAESLAAAIHFGADVVINTREEDLSETVMMETNGLGVDVAIDAAGTTETINTCIDMARRGGKVIFYGIPPINGGANVNILEVITKELTLYGASGNPYIWDKVLDLTSKGVFNLKDMVTHRFKLQDIDEAIDLVWNKRDEVIKAVLLP